MPHFCTGLISSPLLLGKNRRTLEGVRSPLFRPLLAHFLSSASKTQQFSSTQRRNLSVPSHAMLFLHTCSENPPFSMPPPPGLRETLPSHSVSSPLPASLVCSTGLFCLLVYSELVLSCSKTGPVFIPIHSIVPGIQGCQAPNVHGLYCILPHKEVVAEYFSRKTELVLWVFIL